MTTGPKPVLPSSRRYGDQGEEEQAGTEERTETLIHRVVLVLAAVGLFWGSFETYGNGLRLPWVGVVAVLGFIFPPLIVAGVMCARSERTLTRLDIVVLVLGIAILIAWTWPALDLFPQHQSDEGALVDYAASLLRNGQDPYSQHLMTAYLQNPIPGSKFTPLISGSVADQLGYPPVPVLASAALMPIVGSVSALAMATLIAVAVTMVLMFIVLPAPWRGLGVLISVGLPAFNAFVYFGLTEMLLVPMLVVVAFRWNRIGAGGRLGVGGITRAVLLGMAAATQQLTWFIIPFLLVGIYLLRRTELGRRAAVIVLARFSAIAAATFLVINLPFLIWDPNGWLTSIFAPITQHAVPVGNAFVGLAPIDHIGGGNLDYYSYAAFAGVLVLLLAYAMHFHRLGPACFVLPTVALLLPTRSLAVYLMVPAAFWIVGMLTVDRGAIAQVPPLLRGRLAPALRRWGIVGLALVPLAILGVALSEPGPLTITITNLDTMTAGQFFRNLQVQVTNNSGERLAPHFMVTDAAETGSPFWEIVDGPVWLAPHATTTYTLAAPSGVYVPSDYAAFQLEAVTNNPQTASWSNTYQPRPYFVSMPILPAALNAKVGTTMHFHTQLQGPYGGPVQQGGVQIVFSILEQLPDPNGTVVAPTTFAIKGAAPGQNSLTIPTDANGAASFDLTCLQPSANVTVANAYILAPDGKTTFGSSQSVPLRCHA